MSDKSYCKTIEEAISRGELQELQRLIQQGKGNVNQVDKKTEFTPLHWTAHYGSLECLHWLLWNGANINSETKQGWSAAHISAIRGRDSCIVALAANDIDLNKQDNRGKTPAHLAASHGNTSTLQEILRKGADVNIADKMLWNIAHTAAYHGRLGCLQLTKKWNCDFKALDENGNTIVHLCSNQGHLQCLKYLISVLPNIRNLLKLRNDHGETAKDLAEQSLHDDAFIYLDKVEFDLDHPEQNENMAYPAHVSAYRGDLDYLKTLIESCIASINDQDTNGSTPAHKAAGNGQVNALKWLIEKGANLEVLNHAYETPKDVAIRFGQLACIKILGGDADLIELENAEERIITSPINFNEKQAKAQAEEKLHLLTKQVEIAKMNYKQLGGVLKEDEDFIKQQQEHSRVVASLNKQLEYEREKREKLESRLDNLRIQVHNLTIQLEDAGELLETKEALLKEALSRNKIQETNVVKKKPKRKKIRPGIFVVKSPNNLIVNNIKQPAPPQRPKSGVSSKSKVSATSRTVSSLSKASTFKSQQSDTSNNSLNSSFASYASNNNLSSSPSDSLSEGEKSSDGKITQ